MQANFQLLTGDSAIGLTIARHTVLSGRQHCVGELLGNIVQHTLNFYKSLPDYNEKKYFPIGKIKIYMW